MTTGGGDGLGLVVFACIEGGGEWSFFGLWIRVGCNSSAVFMWDADKALRLVLEGTVSETGKEFFRALVRNLAAVTGAAGAWVTEYSPKERRLKAKAFWLNGEYMEGFETRIDGTPCEAVVEGKKLLHIPDRIVELYPEDPDLVMTKAVSYMGVPLLDTDGGVMGHLAILDTKVMPAEPRMMSLFEIFAARAAAEFRRLRVEEEVVAREEELSALFSSAMDAVIVLNEELKIKRMNPAGERIFSCRAAELTEQPFQKLLHETERARFEGFLGEVGVKQQMWIPDTMQVIGLDGCTFPAEATVSKFENRGASFYTIILRNVNERFEAANKIEALRLRNEYLLTELRCLGNSSKIICESPAFRRVLQEVEQVAGTDAAVLIQGETGTGKELLARAVHGLSRRNEGPLVVVNCAAIPMALMESEFFGHEKGAFTGATTKREGRFGLADGGTIFLDEVGEIPLEMQAKLLRVLQEGTFEPVGGSKTRRVDVRLVAATNRDLAEEVAAGRFRQDLFYRLNVFPIEVPPLRERTEDIAPLARFFAEKFAKPLGRRIEPLRSEEIERLQRYHWPGNIRELQNVIERGVITAVNGRINLEKALPEVVLPRTSMESATEKAILTLREMEAMERENVERALAAAKGRISGKAGAAALLGIPPSTLRSRIKALRVGGG